MRRRVLSDIVREWHTKRPEPLVRRFSRESGVIATFLSLVLLGSSPYFQFCLSCLASALGNSVLAR